MKGKFPLIRITKRIYSKTLHDYYDYAVLKLSEELKEAYVLYVLDGKDYLSLGDFEATVKHVVKKHPPRMKQMIMVFIHPGSSLARWHFYSRDGDDFNQYIQFMMNEFVPTFENELESSGIKIKKRGFLGDSLAGNMALNLAMKQPEKNTYLLLQSAAISKADINALRSIDELAWHVYQTVGIYEDEFVSPITNEKLSILTRNRELNNILTEQGAFVKYVEQKEDHTWTFWKRDLFNALKFFIEFREG